MWRWWMISLIWNLQLLICKLEARQRMWEIQTQFIFLVLLRFFLCLWSVCANTTIVFVPEITWKNIFNDELWVAKLERILSICCTFMVCLISCSFFHTHASGHRRKWKQHCKSHGCRGRAEGGETQFGFLHWVGYQISSSPSISTYWNRYSQEDKPKRILVLPDPLSFDSLIVCEDRWHELFGGKSKLGLQGKFRFS